MKNNTGGLDMDQSQLFLHIGLSNGVLLRAQVDPISDSRARYLGTQPIKLRKVIVQGEPAMIAISSRSWLCYNFMSKYQMSPMSIEGLTSVASFSSEQCREGMIGIFGSSLKIFAVDKLGEMFNQITMPLMYTVRDMKYDLEMKKIFTLETDHLTYDSSTREIIKNQIYEHTGDEEYKNVPENQIGYPKAPNGQWASCIRVINPIDLTTVHLMELGANEAAFSMFITDRLGAGDTTYLILGSAKNMKIKPKSCDLGFISVYYFTQDGDLRLMHKTQTEDLPM
mmetsp:Transcript_37114/g.36700  ORF Transcript_37114/g.36700 Transcript_37114/m.36700 type:complete len:282 (-) Transcript_37114:680-1525(-)